MTVTLAGIYQDLTFFFTIPPVAVLESVRRDKRAHTAVSLQFSSSLPSSLRHEAIRCVFFFDRGRQKPYVHPSCFLMETNRAGKLFSWGSNESGQLGLEGCSTTHPLPSLVPTPSDVKFVSVEANGSHSVAVTGVLKKLTS